MPKSKTFVIVESPTKAKTIGRFLPSDFVVESSFGHIRDLPKSKLGIDLENNFAPQYIIPLKAKKRVTALKKEAAKAAKVILATDSDREGEAIAWHLAQALDLGGNGESAEASGSAPRFERIVFHEITQSAIQEALRNPRALDVHLVDAQQARRVLDRLVGYKLSPFLWKKVVRGLSAGRVQSVALRLIVDREEEIKRFKPQEYWTIEADLRAGSGNFTAELQAVAGQSLDKFGVADEKTAQGLTDDLRSAAYSVKEVEKKEMRRNPLPPFTTSTLQQTASQRLGMSAQKTMYVAQQLYENGFITYMRTDSVNIAQEAVRAAGQWIGANLPPEYLSTEARFFKSKSRLAQEAHEAIRPTDPNLSPEQASFAGPSERDLSRLYELIWRRFIATQLPPARFDLLKIEVDARSKKDYLLRANGTSLQFDGFLRIWPTKFEEKILPPLAAGEKLELLEIRPGQHFTEPPPRYNEASLIKTLEQYGIGRPSTYAPIIGVIKARNYVEKMQGRFFPTEIGTLVNQVLTEHFPEVVDVQFTAKMEAELDEIAEGKMAWQNVVREFYEPFAKHLETKYAEVSKKELVEETTDAKCEKCGKPMAVKMGRFGKFLACTGFPECKTTKTLREPPKSTGLKCPKCLVTPERQSEPGELLERRVSRGRARGKMFWGCSRYPDCDFATWTDPAKETPVYDPVKEAAAKAAREAKANARGGYAKKPGGKKKSAALADS